MYAIPSCQAMENRVHLTLFISRARVDTAATQGTYSRMNTSIEKADRGVNPVMAVRRQRI